VKLSFHTTVTARASAEVASMTREINFPLDHY
jgi:hypothetical protein